MNFLKKYQTPFFLCGCGLLLVVLILVRIWEEPYLARDSYAYLEVGTRWLTMSFGEAAAPFPTLRSFPPGIFFIIRSVAWLGLDPSVCAILLNICVAATIPFALYLMAMEIFDNRHCAYFAALCGSVYPPLIRLSCMVLRDSLYWSFVIWAVWAGMRGAQSRRYRYWIVCALFSAMAILMRKEGIELPVIVLVYWGCEWLFANKHLESLRHNLGAALLYWAVLAAILLPVSRIMAQSGSTWSVLLQNTIVEISKRWK